MSAHSLVGIHVWGDKERAAAALDRLQVQIPQRNPEKPGRGFDRLDDVGNHHLYAQINDTTWGPDFKGISREFPDLAFTALEEGIDWDGTVEHWATNGRSHTESSKHTARPQAAMVFSMLRTTPENEPFSLDFGGAWPDQQSHIVASVNGPMVPAFLQNTVKKDPELSRMSVEAVTDTTLLLTAKTVNDLQKNALSRRLADVAQHFADAYSFRVITYQDVVLGRPVDIDQKRAVDRAVTAHLSNESPAQGHLSLE